MVKFVNHTHYSRELMNEAYKDFLWIKHMKRNIVLFAFSFMLMYVCISTLVEMAKGIQPFGINYLIFLFIAIGLIWSIFSGYESVARRTYDGMKQKGMAMDLSYKFMDNGFEVETSQEKFTIQWQQCLFSLETQHLCLIAINKKFYAVDLQQFSKGSPEDFLVFIKEKTRMRYRRFKV